MLSDSGGRPEVVVGGLTSSVSLAVSSVGSALPPSLRASLSSLGHSSHVMGSVVLDTIGGCGSWGCTSVGMSSPTVGPVSAPALMGVPPGGSGSSSS